MSHAVALVPGLLGFDHHADYTYFSDRLMAAIRSTLQCWFRDPVPVSPVSTSPVGSLAERQLSLIQSLEALDGKLGSPAWHLVGHSTGGVDAALLTRKQRLEYDAQVGSRFSEAPWSDAEARLRDRLRSVTTLSAPHFGSTIVLSPAVAMTHGGGITAHAVAELGGAVWDLTQRGDLDDRIRFALGALGAGGGPRLLLQFAVNDRLVFDLRPSVVGPLTATENRMGIPISSIASWVAPPPAEHPDRLFRDLWGWTEEGNRLANLPPRSLPADGGWVRIGKFPDPFPTIHPGDSDGIVNTVRQVDGELVALVCGDHVDVLGRYRRVDLVDGKVLYPGLLTSGASFGDEDFFKLAFQIALSIGKRMIDAGVERRQVA